MIDGALELTVHPDQKFFSKQPDYKTLMKIEQLLKPSSFTEQADDAARKSTSINIARKHKSIYVNTQAGSVVPQGRGRSNFTSNVGRGAALRRLKPYPGRPSPGQTSSTSIGVPMHTRHAPPPNAQRPVTIYATGPQWGHTRRDVVDIQNGPPLADSQIWTPAAPGSSPLQRQNLASKFG